MIASPLVERKCNKPVDAMLAKKGIMFPVRIALYHEKQKRYLKGADEQVAIGPCFMTEESETEGEGVCQHALPWKSNGMKKTANIIFVKIAKLAGLKLVNVWHLGTYRTRPVPFVF